MDNKVVFTSEEVQAIVETVSKLYSIGFKRMSFGSEYGAYGYSSGSICCWQRVRLGEIQHYEDALGNKVLGVWVCYDAEREGSYDFGDYHKLEERIVRLDKLIEYLAERGIQERDDTKRVGRA